jgi:hypothetical protein
MRILARRLLPPLSLLICLLPASASAAVQADGVSPREVFAGFLAGHFAAFREEAPEATYRSAWVDLDGDGRQEVLVYMDGSLWCGPHSCDLFIFTPAREGGWRLLQELSVAKEPITLLATRSRGWRDLGFYYSTSLAPGERRALSYGRDGYRLSPRRLRPREEGRVLIGDSEGEPLFGPQPSRPR